jgi:hypothetical protein
MVVGILQTRRSVAHNDVSITPLPMLWQRKEQPAMAKAPKAAAKKKAAPKKKAATKASSTKAAKK